MPYATRRRGQRAGFTMIELLTVMGIIIILLSILIPVVATIRRKAYETDTRAEIMKIANACQNYFLDFSAYPGPIPESSVYNTWATLVTPPVQTVGGTQITQITSTQNLTLGLLGGLRPSASGSSQPFTFDPTLLLVGPQSLNPVSPRQYSAYFDPKPGDLTADGVGNVTCAALFPSTPPPGGAIPELNDHFPREATQFHPIIYLRARTGGVNICDAQGQTSSQYWSAEMLAYRFTFPSPADLNNNSQTLYFSSTGFFASPTLQDGYTPRGKDAFILVSAGYDGVFGTYDDIVYPPN